MSVTRIEPRISWTAPDLASIWRHRELLYFLTWRDVKVRYKQTAMGVAWVVLQPVLTTAVFTVIFGRLAGFETGGVPYPLFAMSGIIIWLFVHTSVTTASGSFVNNTNLVTKIYFPRGILPLSVTIGGLVDLGISFAILAGLMTFYQTAISLTIAFVPFFIFAAFVLASSFGLLFSALNVRFRDVKFALPFLLQIWMIASPIFYPLAIVPDRWKTLMAINPLTGIIEGLRASLFGTQLDGNVVAVSGLSLAVIAIFSLLIFKWMEDDFADVI